MVRDGGITNAMGTLVRPTGPIPPGASAVHHTVDEDVAEAPALPPTTANSSGGSSLPRV